VWPLLLERAPADAELVQTMESQHAAVASGLERAHEQLEEWESTTDPAHGERVAVTLSQMTTALLEHLDAEEAHVLALIEAHLSAQEWGKLGEHGMAGVNEQQRPIVIGMFLEDMPDDERAAFVSKLPPPVQQLWRDVWSPAYADYVKAVREPV
jgi:hemerythrin-like domain-containing protein